MSDKAEQEFELWWRTQTRKGDPARNHNLVREAFLAGYEAGTWDDADDLFHKEAERAQ